MVTYVLKLMHPSVRLCLAMQEWTACDPLHSENDKQYFPNEHYNTDIKLNVFDFDISFRMFGWDIQRPIYLPSVSSGWFTDVIPVVGSDG
jgi:hypothetical protein